MAESNKNKAEPVRQNGEIYDAIDLQLALLDLNKRGFALHVTAVDAHRLQVTCKKTHNRFAVECLGHNEWPVHPPRVQK
jgi:hypothetical protein